MKFAAKKGVNHPLSDILDHVFHGKDAHVTIVGCCDMALFQAIGRIKCKTQVEILHYFDARGWELVQAMTAIQPVLYSKLYQGFILEQERRWKWCGHCIATMGYWSIMRTKASGISCTWR